MNEISADIPTMAVWPSNPIDSSNEYLSRRVRDEYNAVGTSGTKDLSHGNESGSRPKWLSFIDRRPHSLGNNSEKLFRSLSSV